MRLYKKATDLSDKELKEFIRYCREQGIAEEDMIQDLVKNGFSPEDARDRIKRLSFEMDQAHE